MTLPDVITTTVGVHNPRNVAEALADAKTVGLNATITNVEKDRWAIRYRPERRRFRRGYAWTAYETFDVYDLMECLPDIAIASGWNKSKRLAKHDAFLALNRAGLLHDPLRSMYFGSVRGLAFLVDGETIYKWDDSMPRPPIIEDVIFTPPQSVAWSSERATH